MIRKLKISDIEQILEVMHQEGVRGYNGQFIDSENDWFMHFFNCQSCYMFGLFEQISEKLLAVIIAETMSDNGCILWYIAVHPDYHRKGYGKKLLEFFEDYVKSDGIKWIYLTASLNSLDFYKNMGYETSKYSTVVEHVKNLIKNDNEKFNKN